MAEIYSKRKEKAVYLFRDSLIAGKIEIDFTKFRTIEQQIKYKDDLEKQMKKIEGELECSDDDPNAMHATTEWIYDFIVKGRQAGAIRGEFLEPAKDPAT